MSFIADKNQEHISMMSLIIPLNPIFESSKKHVIERLGGDNFEKLFIEYKKLTNFVAKADFLYKILLNNEYKLNNHVFDVCECFSFAPGQRENFRQYCKQKYSNEVSSGAIVTEAMIEAARKELLECRFKVNEIEENLVIDFNQCLNSVSHCVPEVDGVSITDMKSLKPKTYLNDRVRQLYCN